MTYTALTTALIGALAILPAPVAQADFTGTWVLDMSRSEGLPEGAAPTTMTVRRSGDRLEVEVLLQTPSGERRIPDVYVLDGVETDFQPRFNVDVSSSGKRTSRWLEDGQGFEASERATAQAPEGEMTFTSTRKWTLAPGGDELTVELTTSGPQGEMKTTRVFTRQQPAAG